MLDNTVLSTGAELEPELGGVTAYKTHNPLANRTLEEKPAHTHIPAAKGRTLTLFYRSLRSNRQSICDGCKK